MRKCTLKRFNYYHKEINFNDGVNYIIGPNGSGKTTLLKLIQYSLGLSNISFPKKILSPVEIEFSTDENNYHFYREFDSNKIIAEIKHGNAYELNVRSNDYFDFLIEIFKPDYELTDNKQIKYLLNEIFFSPEIKNRISNNNITYLMLGIDQKYENDIQKKIDVLSNRLKEKEENLNILLNYKNDVLNSINPSYISNIKNTMEDIYDKYKSQNLSEYSLVEKSKNLLNELKNENGYKVENALEYFEFLNNKYNINNDYLFNDFESSIFSNKMDFTSMGEKTFIEIYKRLLLQSSYKKTNGIGILFNDYNRHLDSMALTKIRGITDCLIADTGLQYIELTYPNKYIDNSKIIFQINWSN